MKKLFQIQYVLRQLKLTIFIARVGEGIVTTIGSVEKYITVATPEEVFGTRKDRALTDELITKQVKVVEDLMRQLENHDKHIPFVTENPGTQLTSSFNPIMEDPQKWYENYFTK